METRAQTRLESLIFADLLATAVVAPLAYGAVEPWAVALFELNALLIAVLMAAKFTFFPQAGRRWSRLSWPLIALTLLGLAQSFQLGASGSSLDPPATREATIKILALTTYFIAAYDVFKQRERRRMTVIFLTTLGCALAIFAIIQKLTWNGRIYWVRLVGPERTPFGPFINPNHFAGMMELIWPLAFAYVLMARAELEKRLLWLFATMMMAVSITLSLSRGGLLSFGIQVLVFAAFSLLLSSSLAGEQVSSRLMVKPGSLIGLVLTAVAALALWIGYDQIASRVRTVNQGAQELSLAGRLSAWRASRLMIEDYPLTGVGLGAFPTAYPSYGRSSALRERLEQTHNDYLQLLTDGGLVGGAIGLWFVVELILCARRQWRTLDQTHGLERALFIGGLVALIGLGAHSFTDFNLQITSNALLFLLITALTIQGAAQTK